MKFFKYFVLVMVLMAVMSISGFAQDAVIVEKADGTYTVIEYPVGKETVVNLVAVTPIDGARGLATVLRADDGTKIVLDLNGIEIKEGSAKVVHAYAVEPNGATRYLGPVEIAEGSGKAEFSTDLSQFMIVLSPNAGVSSWNPTTPVYFRSEVPQGFAVVPVTRTGDEDSRAVGAAVNTPYQVPLIGVPTFGGETHEMKIDFSGELSGLKGKAYIDPGAAGTTQIKMRFDDMKMAPKGKRFVLWASSANGEYTKLGQVVNTGERQESEIRSETALPDFGLFVTVEDADVTKPTSRTYSVFRRL